jgi:hypothetical protein
VIEKETFEKMSREFNERYVWIISFYKENGGITISDSHFDDEISVQAGYEFRKEMSNYDLSFHFKVFEDKIICSINDYPIELSWNDSYYNYLRDDKKIWICTRDYENHFN